MNAECQHLETWFDRSICPCDPDSMVGGVMHTYCADCGDIEGPNERAQHQAWIDSFPVTLLQDTAEDRELLASYFAAKHRNYPDGKAAEADLKDADDLIEWLREDDA